MGGSREQQELSPLLPPLPPASQEEEAEAGESSEDGDDEESEGSDGDEEGSDGGSEEEERLRAKRMFQAPPPREMPARATRGQRMGNLMATEEGDDEFWCVGTPPQPRRLSPARRLPSLPLARLPAAPCSCPRPAPLAWLPMLPCRPPPRRRALQEPGVFRRGDGGRGVCDGERAGGPL